MDVVMALHWPRISGGDCSGSVLDTKRHLLRRQLDPGDQLLIGFDLKKDPEIILKAYNDPAGITAAFNLNLLNGLGADEVSIQLAELKLAQSVVDLLFSEHCANLSGLFKKVAQSLSLLGPKTKPDHDIWAN